MKVYLMRQLRKLGDLTGYSLQARDGEVGKLEEVYFDDQRWTVRYFVVHTGSWLFGQDVLIVPSLITAIDDEHKCLVVDMNREQVRDCPPVDRALPVSRRYEREYFDYYDWEPYWIGDPLLNPMPDTPSPDIAPPDEADSSSKIEYLHLRSSDDVKGYHISARNSKFGHVEDLVVEHPGWIMRYLVVDTRNWLPGRNILLSPAWVEEIDWLNNAVSIDLPREAIQNAPPYDASIVIGRDDEIALYKHYGMKYVEG